MDTSSNAFKVLNCYIFSDSSGIQLTPAITNDIRALVIINYGITSEYRAKFVDGWAMAVLKCINSSLLDTVTFTIIKEMLSLNKAKYYFK